jgi:flagellar biosynthesis protein FliR
MNLDILNIFNDADLLAVIALTLRTFAVIISLPTGDGLQMLPRIFISLCFALALLPAVEGVNDISYGALIFEFLIGLLIAAPLRFVVESSEMFGEIIDTARGQTIGSIVDPINGQQGSDMASVMRLGMLVFAINLGAFDSAVEALAASYKAVPLGGLFAEEILSQYQSLFEVAFQQAVSVITTSLSFSASWLVAYLVIDISSGMLAKVVQGVQFTSTATVLKMAVTFILFLNLSLDSKELGGLVGRFLPREIFSDYLR